MDSDWHVTRKYYHSETIAIACASSYVASGGECKKAFTVVCWDGEFKTQDTLSPEVPVCHAVVCLDEAGQKNTCGQGMCPPFSSVSGTNSEKVSFIVTLYST
jgi:hypothetical protein